MNSSTFSKGLYLFVIKINEYWFEENLIYVKVMLAIFENCDLKII